MLKFVRQVSMEIYNILMKYFTKVTLHTWLCERWSVIFESAALTGSRVLSELETLIYPSQLSCERVLY